MKEKEKIQHLYKSNLYLSLCFSGAGFSFINTLLSTEGASSTLLNADVPYSKYSLVNHYYLKEPFISNMNSTKICQLLQDEYSKAIDKKINKKKTQLMTISCLGSIKTIKNKKGNHHAWVSLQSNNSSKHIYINLEKNLRSRIDEDLIIKSILIDSIYEFINKNSFSSTDPYWLRKINLTKEEKEGLIII
jgi:hypothetical protein